MPNIVGVKFRETGKVYYFAPNNLVFEKDDGVIVQTARGTEYGTVVIANREVPESDVKGELKSVVRKASAKDTQNYQANVERRLPSIKQAQKLADKRKLDMKIVDAEFAFDNSKVLFYFKSDNRIDFRELVKDLASAFKMRIELRQIGIRDECKMLGGLGPCGRVCCCNDYMADFERVSIKMAKHQGLSLNPGKISGLCGRLMCCLKFEDEYYANTLKFMPKVGSEINTPKGKGKVQSVDMLRQLVVVRVSTGEESSECFEYDLPTLGITPVYPPFNCGKCCNGSDEVDEAGDDDGDILPEE